MKISRRAALEAAALAIVCLAASAALIRSGSGPAHADAKCAATCNATHDQCLASTNDRYTCDSQRNQCLKSCGAGY